MITFIASLGLLILIYILSKYTSLITKRQSNFVMVFSLLTLMLFAFVQPYLTGNMTSPNGFNHPIMMVTTFFIIWYMISVMLSNTLTYNQDYLPYFDNSQWVSERKELSP